jgi:hypothetical protein
MVPLPSVFFPNWYTNLPDFAVDFAAARFAGLAALDLFATDFAFPAFRATFFAI